MSLGYVWLNCEEHVLPGRRESVVHLQLVNRRRPEFISSKKWLAWYSLPRFFWRVNIHKVSKIISEKSRISTFPTKLSFWPKLFSLKTPSVAEADGRHRCSCKTSNQAGVPVHIVLNIHGRRW